MKHFRHIVKLRVTCKWYDQDDGSGFHYHSGLDWCNALYYGITDELMRRLQSVQNAAARLITGTRRCDHISHRCFASCTGFQRVSYKIVTLVHRCLSQATWLTICRLITDVRRLRSANTRTLVVGRTQSSFIDRTFAAAAPLLWNSLPSDTRQPDLSYGQFRRSLLSCRAVAYCDPS